MNRFMTIPSIGKLLSTTSWRCRHPSVVVRGASGCAGDAGWNGPTQRMMTTTVTTTTISDVHHHVHHHHHHNYNVHQRDFSTITLKRPPHRREEPDPRRKWRIHGVSLEFGDYSYDDDDDDDDDGRSNPYYPDRDGTTSPQQPSPPSWQDEEGQLAAQIQELQDDRDEQKRRWLENAKPPVRVPIIDERGRAYGRGGRKTASARVWIQPGFGVVVVNRQDFVDYFERTTDREHLLAPLAATATCGKFDITALVNGGGLTGQAGAIRHGLARALNHYNPDEYRPPLKRLGYLTRDPRKVERKKVGHLKARKKPQWVKR